MDNYSILIQYDDIDKIYVTRIPELQGCIAHGKTQAEALREINIAKELWLKTAAETGQNIPISNSIAAI